MFDTEKFGGYLSRPRKNADMTHMELADRLDLTRQAWREIWDRQRKNGEL